MKPKMNFLLVATVLSGFGLAARANPSWDLTQNYTTGGATAPWSYGSVNSVGNAFTSLSWISGSYPNANGYYGYVPSTSGAFVYQNSASTAYYGIAPGQISLESDYGNAAAQWTAPAAGEYDVVAAMIGGTTAQEGGPGYGNNYAQYAGLNINGVSQTGTFANNVMSWTISDIHLAAGQTIDVYVLNPGAANGGNTQAEFTIDQVPDSGMTAMLLGLGLTGLAAFRRKLGVN